MARLNGLISKMSGSAGKLNFRRREGMTIVSEKVTEVKNPRTSAQQQTRMKWGNIIQMYEAFTIAQRKIAETVCECCLILQFCNFYRLQNGLITRI